MLVYLTKHAARLLGFVLSFGLLYSAVLAFEYTLYFYPSSSYFWFRLQIVRWVLVLCLLFVSCRCFLLFFWKLLHLVFFDSSATTTSDKNQCFTFCSDFCSSLCSLCSLCSICPLCSSLCSSICVALDFLCFTLLKSIALLLASPLFRKHGCIRFYPGNCNGFFR